MRSRCAGADVGLNFKNKTGKFVFIWIYQARDGGSRHRRRGDFHKSIQQFLDAEIVDGAAEKNRCLAGLYVIMVDGEHHFPQGSGHSMRGESGAVQLRHDLLFNVVAVGAGYSVLRLHHLHKHSWQSAVLKFIQYCANGGAPLHFWEPPWMYIKDAQQVWAHG